MYLCKLFAFLKRDMLESLSYKTQFILDTGSMLTQTLIFFYIAKLLSQGESPLLENYRGDFFSFVLLGVAFASYHAAALGSFSKSIYREQSAGTLEAIVLSPTSLQTVVLSSLFWTLIFTSLRLCFYLTIGFVFFKANFSRINFCSAGLTLLLMFSSLSGFGMISAGLVLILKRADPLSFILNGVSRLISGVYFPLALLPSGVKTLALLLPLTTGLEAMRKSVLLGTGSEGLWKEWLTLGFFSILLIPAGLLFFKYSLRRVLRDGTLHQS